MLAIFLFFPPQGPWLPAAAAAGAATVGLGHVAGVDLLSIELLLAAMILVAAIAVVRRTIDDDLDEARVEDVIRVLPLVPGPNTATGDDQDVALDAVHLDLEADFVPDVRLVAVWGLAHIDVPDLGPHCHLAEDWQAEAHRGVTLGDRLGRPHLAVLVDLRGRLHDAAVPIRRRAEHQALGHGGRNLEGPVGHLILGRSRLQRACRLVLQLLLAQAPSFGALQAVNLVALLLDYHACDLEHHGVELQHRLLLLEHVDGDCQAHEQVAGHFGQTAHLVLCQDCAFFQLLDLLRFRNHENCLL